MRKLELLAPAKNLECGKAAIDHGADAVYIGAAKFGARASAGNSLDDIRELCLYAHQFGAKVYVTVNTIVYQDELEDTRALLRALTEMRVDALLVQDMAVLDLLPKDVKPLPALHASTQTDNRTAEMVAWLHGLGFERIGNAAPRGGASHRVGTSQRSGNAIRACVCVPNSSVSAQAKRHLGMATRIP